MMYGRVVHLIIIVNWSPYIVEWEHKTFPIPHHPFDWHVYHVSVLYVLYSRTQMISVLPVYRKYVYIQLCIFRLLDGNKKNKVQRPFKSSERSETKVLFFVYLSEYCNHDMHLNPWGLGLSSVYSFATELKFKTEWGVSITSFFF